MFPLLGDASLAIRLITGFRQLLVPELILLGICSTMFCLVAPAAADEVDTAVEAFAAAGTVLGVSPGPNEKQLAKVLVRCVVIDKKSVLRCGRDEALRALPDDVRPLTVCMMNGSPIEVCASAELLRRLPPQTRELASCIATRSDLGNCATHAIANPAQRQALDIIDKLKADARSELGQPSPGPIRNIINVAEGIRDDDWAKVSIYGGAEAYKAAAKLVLRIVIPGGSALAPIIDPVVDVVVQNRVDLAVDLIKAVKARDEAKIGRLIVEFYLTAHVEMGCALFDALPKGSVTQTIREATCGNIGKVIRAVGSVGSDAVDLTVNAMRDVLTGVGIDPTGIFGTDRRCGTTASWYTRSNAVCLKHAAYLSMTDPKRFGEVEGAINSSCRQHFTPCNERFLVGGTSGRLNEVCDPLRNHFNQEVSQLVGGLNDMARVYARSHLADISPPPAGHKCDASNTGSFVARCANALGAQAPGLKSANFMNCGDPSWRLPRPDVFEAACTRVACTIAANPRLAACQRYAQQALGTAKYAHDMNCDPKVISGPRWTATFSEHLQFCMTAPVQTVNFEERERGRISQECRIAAAMPHGVSTLEVRQIAATGAFYLKGKGFEINSRVAVEISGPAARPQVITNNFADRDGNVAITLPHAAVCVRTGIVRFVARDADKPPTKQVMLQCRPCSSPACRAPFAEFKVTEPRGHASFTITGTGFSPSGKVAIVFSSSASGLPKLPLQIVRADGTFEVTLQSKDFCLKPGWLSIEVTEQGKPTLQSKRVACN